MKKKIVRIKVIYSYCQKVPNLLFKTPQQDFSYFMKLLTSIKQFYTLQYENSTLINVDINSTTCYEANETKPFNLSINHNYFTILIIN